METKQYCRLCLGQSANLLWVFDQRFEVNNHLKDLIFKTTGVKISQEDSISQKICHKCGENVVKLYEFRQQSIKNDQFLKEQQRTQKKKPHRSILNIFQKYPRILIPDLEICLSEDISPVVEMRMDEVENHFKSKNLDFQKHVIQVLRQDKQKQRAINAALKSKNPSNNSNETVSPISIKFRQDKSSYEIVHKNDDEVSTDSNNSLKHLGNHRKRQLSDCEQSCSSKRSPTKNSSSALTIPNRRQSIGPIEFNSRPDPSDLDATLLEALEVSEKQNVPLTPTKRSPAIISNILIKPADKSILYHNVNDTSNKKLKEIVPNTAINSSTFNDLSSTSCDDNYLRINNTNNHPKPGVMDHLKFLKKSLITEGSCSSINTGMSHSAPVDAVNKQFIPNPSLVSPTLNRPYHHINENSIPSIIPVNLPILPKDKVVKHLIPNQNFRPQTVTRPHQHTYVNLVPNLNGHVLPKNTIIKESVPNSNFFPTNVTRRQHPTNENFVTNIHVNPTVLPKRTIVEQFIPNSNSFPSRPIVPNTSTVEPRFVQTNTVSRHFTPIQSFFYPSTDLQIATKSPESVSISTETVSNLDKNDKRLPLQTSPSISLVPDAIPATFKPVETTPVPYIFEVDEYLNPIKSISEFMISKVSNPQKSINERNRSAESIGVSTEIVSNLDKNDKRPPLQTAPSISLVPNTIPDISKPVGATPDPYIFEVDKYLNPTKALSELKITNNSNTQKSNIESQPKPISTKVSDLKQTNSKYSNSKTEHKRSAVSIGVRTEIVSNLDKSDKRPPLQTTPSISLVPNAIPAAAKLVETTPDPYIFEVDEYLNPIKAISELKITKVSNPQKSTIESQPKPISTKASASKQTISKYSTSKIELNRSTESVGISTETVSNLDKSDKRPPLQTTPSISLVPNAIPATSKPVETIPDPYIFEVDEYLNPIKAISEFKITKVLNPRKSNIESQPKPIFTKASASKQTISKYSSSKNEPEFTCNFCRESFTTLEIGQAHLKTCRIKKEVEVPVYVLLENIEHNVDIKRQYHKVFSDLAKTHSNNIIEILDTTEEPSVKMENLVLNLTPQVEIKNSNFPNINYTSKTTDILKRLLVYDKNESPVDQNSQTELSSESPELGNVISSWKMCPKKDSIHSQNNSFSLDHLKSYIHLYKIPVSIDYKKSFDVNYNFEEPPKRKKTFDDWDDLTPIDVVKSPTIVRKQVSTPIEKDIPNITDLAPPASVPNPGEALDFPVENICQNVLNVSRPSTSQNIDSNSIQINQLRDSVITKTSLNVEATETLPDLGDIELFANDLVCAERVTPSSDSGIFESTSSNQSYPNELINNPQTNYVVQPQQNPVYQQMDTHVQPNAISTGNYQTTVYPTTAGERINGLETSYFENYMNYQQPQIFRSNKTWYPTQNRQNPVMYKDVRAPPPPYNIHHQRIPPEPEKRNAQNALPHPYNHINSYNPSLVNNYYAYNQNSNQNVNIPSRSNYYNRNFVPDVSNVPTYNMTDNYKDGMQIDSAITPTSDTATNASTIRVRPLSDLK
ncbi:unnamed protein product [Psylliodes chrysocephalus]|uniref:ZAD domain-containing protein n=1 Tax=Psylliodes chrysocephalus TaxID=3402493 RepID=A0A9P0GL19_9CUCU|nr:unnamed protein product [Psylliodes chrysocephala]